MADPSAVSSDAIVTASSAPAATAAKKAPLAWAKVKRPHDGPTHGEKIAGTNFDAFLAGARFANRWEDEWPLITEEQFDAAMKAVGDIRLG